MRTLSKQSGWLLMAFLFVVGQASASETSEPVGVITALVSAHEVSIIAEDRRPASLFALLRRGESLHVQGDGRATIHVAGTDYVVSSANSPFELPDAETGSSVGENVLEWAMSLVGGGEEAPVASVAMASRGQAESLSIRTLSPLRNYLQRRAALVLLHDARTPVDRAVLSTEDGAYSVPLSHNEDGVAVLDMQAVPEGEYALEVCSEQACAYGTLNWLDRLGGDRPSAYQENSGVLGALALVREGDAYLLEGAQQLWLLRESNELAAAALQRLRAVRIVEQ